MKFIIGCLAAATLFCTACGTASSDKKTNEDTVTTTSPTDNTSVVTIDPPAAVATGFKAKYPQATNVRWGYYRPEMTPVEWEWTGWPAPDTTTYVATYYWDGTDYWAMFDEEGNWIGTISPVTNFSTLPAPVNATINKQYAGYSIVSVDLENDKDRTVYEIELEGSGGKTKLLVDENGKVLKSKSTNADTKTKTNPKDSM